MKEKDVIKLLQFYQHDLMNEIQVIHGYLSMNKLDIAQDKMQDFINEFNEARKLLKVNASQFILWIFRFNHCHEHIRLTYQVNDDQLNVEEIDDLLVKYCKQIVQNISKMGKQNKLYDIHLEIDQKDFNAVRLLFTVTGEFEYKSAVIHSCKVDAQNPQVHIKETSDGFINEFIFSME